MEANLCEKCGRDCFYKNSGFPIKKCKDFLPKTKQTTVDKFLERGRSSTRAHSSDEGSKKAGLSNGRSESRVALRPRRPSKKCETSQVCSGERRLRWDADKALSLTSFQQSMSFCRRNQETDESSSEWNVKCKRKPEEAKF